MSAHFQNTFLPGVSGKEVCDAITRWHVSEGFEPQRSNSWRDPFDCQDSERQAFVLWNEKWCVVLHSDEQEKAAGVRWALREFPAVIQLWAKEGAWGYRLEEHGQRTTSYCSKHGLETLDEPLARTKSDLKRLTTVCGVPQARRKLRRLESWFVLSKEGLWEKFATALDVPTAVMSFYDLHDFKTALSEERTIDGWKIRTLAFRRTVELKKVANKIPQFDQLSDEDKAYFQAIQKKSKSDKWILILLFPLWGLLALFALVIVISWILYFVIAEILQKTPIIRHALTSKAKRFNDDFIKHISGLVPQEIHINGERVTNTRYQCSVVVRPPVKAFPEIRPLKGSEFSDRVFDFQLDDLLIYCEAFHVGRKPKWGNMKALEERAFSAGEYSGQFQKLCTLNTKTAWVHNEWTLDATSATYQFRCAHEAELTAEQLETLEAMISSFRCNAVE